MAGFSGIRNRAEWSLLPQQVDANYDPLKNTIEVPASILQPPFFDPLADSAINCGAIGAVIAREIAHAFDDKGRKFAGSGVLRDWWATEDAVKFQAQAQRLGKQFGSYEPQPGFKINADRTMGENISDRGGVAVALNAYRLSLNGKASAKIAGFSGEQRVFMGWAQALRGKFRGDLEIQNLLVDPHSPNYYRVNGIVRNLDEWYQAFNVKAGDKLYLAPEDRVRIW